jgi:hypothetical protein
MAYPQVLTKGDLHKSVSQEHPPDNSDAATLILNVK